MSDYEDILNQSWDNIPQPKTLPEGSYLLKGRNASFQAGKEGQSNSFLFVYQVREAMDDVDADKLAELGADYDMENNQVFHKVWVETSVDYDKVRKHLALHGIEAKGSIADTLKSFKGSQVIAYLKLRTYLDKSGQQITTNQAEQFAKVE